MAHISRQVPCWCLLILILSTVVMAVGLALYRWYYFADGYVYGGLFTICGKFRESEGRYDDYCHSLNSEFTIPGVEATSMPDSWLATQVLMGTSVFCIIVAILANIAWIMRPAERPIALVCAGFTLLGGVFGVFGVLVFGIFWDNFINDFAFWLVVGGVCALFLIGLVCLPVLLCMPQAWGLYQKRVTVIRKRPETWGCSPPEPTPAPACNNNNTTVVRPEIIALPPPAPAPAPAPALPPPAPAPIILPPPPAPQPPQTIIIQSPPAQAPVVTEPADVRVNCNYRGDSNYNTAYGDEQYICETYYDDYPDHSAQIYVTDPGYNGEQYYYE